ncbi:uncharacterized protein N7473_006483 [Penicillium subrubescens]|uniref:GPI anchored protein n=1 Tax=Penicillium subrubescens TaxID=1316194 RepID=A0A1Q5TCV5_9EURO|nr:uncharacterized protein N7473_006483 [Penicillium subrubescens]KAJ5897084.1 hypothetical protein N7473_006483 [Penicillium subrubescens]OKO98048.1 hypothetical protein PENSUB_9628 [Penicillium subrubescens]
MHFKSLALVAGAAIAAADSTVTLFLPGFDAQSIDAKILGSSSTMTTYLLNCPPGADPNNCGLPDVGYRVTAGGSTVLYTMSYEEETISQSCKLEGTTSAFCWGAITSGTVTSTDSTSFGIATIPYGGFQAVHVTATQTGDASASTGASASAPTATMTKTTASIGSTTTATSTGTASQTGSTGTSTASTSASHSSNAAMPMMTGNALWVAGGAAAALALVAV